MDRSWGYGSERGLRKDNDDTFGVFQFTDFTVAVICDGVGGTNSGRHASKLAVRTIYDTLSGPLPAEKPEALREAISQANGHIFDESRRNHRLTGMGSTVVIAAVTDDEAYIAHVGDSRAYLVKDGTVKQLTVDHTMVNLFVESGLLSPEEAQTHPEANVLSRTVGIERSVEIEVTGPIKLDENDVIFVCSDGVHSVLTDWEIGNIDWDLPQQGVQQVLEMLAERESNDNATVIAISMAQCDENISLTPPPDISSDVSATLTPAAKSRIEEPESPPPTPTAEAEKEGNPWQYSDDADTSESGLSVVPTPPSPPMPQKKAPLSVPPPPPLGDILGTGALESQTAGPPSGAPTLTPPVPPPPPGALPAGIPSLRKSKDNGLWLKALAPAIVLGLSAALFVGMAYLKFGSNGEGNAMQAQLQSNDPNQAQPVPVQIEATARLSLSNPASESVAPRPQLQDVGDSFFAPFIPPSPKRIHHQPSIYIQPSPGGPHQWKAVQAARNKLCATALDATVTAMSDSSDHASLYAQVWHCFNEHHQTSLLNARLNNLEEFSLLIPDLQGTEGVDNDQPGWYQPANGGIEKRLRMWRDSNQTDLFTAVIDDLIGAPSAADSLATDVLIEAQAAVMLSRTARLLGVNAENSEIHHRLISWWARRVYVVSMALNGSVGEKIRTHRPELITQIQNQLDEAAWRPQGPGDSVAIAAPQAITEAYAVGMGAMAQPSLSAKQEEEEATKKAIIRRQAQPKPEPEITAPFIIHRLEKVPRPLPGTSN